MVSPKKQKLKELDSKPLRLTSEIKERVSSEDKDVDECGSVFSEVV